MQIFSGTAARTDSPPTALQIFVGVVPRDGARCMSPVASCTDKRGAPVCTSLMELVFCDADAAIEADSCRSNARKNLVFPLD